MELRHVSLDDPAAEELLRGLADEYDRRYGRAGRTGVMADARAEDFSPPRGTFVVLVDDDGRTVAGGGLRALSADTAELKRMWTAPHARRRGHARTVLQALEAVARDQGCTRVRLETGPAQPEAVALYRRLGYVEAEHSGRYEQAIGFERSLSELDSPTDPTSTDPSPPDPSPPDLSPTDPTPTDPSPPDLSPTAPPTPAPPRRPAPPASGRAAGRA